MRLALVTLHRWLGLFTAVFLAIAGLTGAVIAWERELDALLNPELFRCAEGGRVKEPLALVAELESRDPRLFVRYFPLALAPGHTALLSVAPRLDANTGKPHALDFDQVFVDPHSGEVRATRLWGAPALARKNLLPFLYRLHYSLHLPEGFGVELGVLFMGIVALVWFLDAFIALSISFPRGSDWVKSFAFRVRTGGYRLVFDLHRSSGVWLWPLLLVFAVTAIDLNLRDQVLRPLVAAFSPLTPDPFDERAGGQHRRPVPRVAREQVLESARVEAARLGLKRPLGGMFYAAEAGLYGVGLYGPGEEYADGSLGNPWLHFDGQSGAFVSAHLPGRGSAGDVFLQLQFPLHSGRIAGVLGRVLVTLLGLALCMLSVTGIVIWARKRRGRYSTASKRVRQSEPSSSHVSGQV
jgi:uncharacterized iron-regulated membrane protein